jgi:hypothetical protein
MSSTTRTKTFHGILKVALLLAAGSPALAQSSRLCPVDGVQRLNLPPFVAWNAAAGVDSDGCRYAVDELGRRRIQGQDAVIQCARCRVCFLPEQLDVKLSDSERAQLGEATLAAERAGASRWELAALTCEQLGARGLPAGVDPELRLGEVYLRAAWAARGAAVLPGADGGYRPRSVQEAREQLVTLGLRANADPRRDPEVLRLDRLLEDLEDTRLGLPAAHLDARARRKLLLSQAHLAALERRLLERKAQALAAAGGQISGLDQGELLEALIKAWIRYGDPGRWEPLLRRLLQRGERNARARAIRRAVDAEARLLGLAGLHLRIASQAGALAPGERSRIVYLLGDGERRRGELARGRADLKRAVQLDPDGEPARWASALLAGD